MNIAEKENWPKFNYKEERMSKKVKDLYDLYVEEIASDEMPIFEPGERKYIRIWTDIQPIQEYYIILDTEKAKYYKVRKYTDKEILMLEAIYRSVVRALYTAEKYDFCKNIEVADYDLYKDAERLENILRED